MTQFTAEHRKILAEARRFRPECVLSVGDVSDCRHPLLWRRDNCSPWFARDENWANAAFYSGHGGDHSLDRDSALLLCVALSESRILGLDSLDTKWVDEIAKANGIEVTWRKPARDDHLTPQVGETWSTVDPATYPAVLITGYDGFYYTFDTDKTTSGRDGYQRPALVKRLREANVLDISVLTIKGKPVTWQSIKVDVNIAGPRWDSEKHFGVPGVDSFGLDRRIAAAMVEHDAKRKAVRTGPLRNRDRYGQLIGGGWETDCDEP